MYCIEYAAKLLSCFQSYVEAVSYTSVLRSWALGVIASWGQSLIQCPYDKGKEELLPGLLPRDVTTQHQVTAFVFVVLLVFDTGSPAAPTGLELLSAGVQIRHHAWHKALLLPHRESSLHQTGKLQAA